LESSYSKHLGWCSPAVRFTSCPLPSGLGGAGSNNIWGCRVLKINPILLERFYVLFYVPKPDCNGKPVSEVRVRTGNEKQD